jgi:hypothetical protein
MPNKKDPFRVFHLIGGELKNINEKWFAMPGKHLSIEKFDTGNFTKKTNPTIYQAAC